VVQVVAISHRRYRVSGAGAGCGVPEVRVLGYGVRHMICEV